MLVGFGHVFLMALSLAEDPLNSSALGFFYHFGGQARLLTIIAIGTDPDSAG
jgi:hypothetical protein